MKKKKDDHLIQQQKPSTLLPRVTSSWARPVPSDAYMSFVLTRCHVMRTHGFANYFGPQRFGAMTTTIGDVCDQSIVHLPGLHILRKDYQEAVDQLFTYVPQIARLDASAVATRDAYLQGGYRAAANHIPSRMWDIAKMCRCLHEHRGSPLPSLCRMPRKNRLLWLKQIDSYIFNLVLHRRLSRYGPEVRVGDWIQKEEDEEESDAAYAADHQTVHNITNNDDDDDGDSLLRSHFGVKLRKVTQADLCPPPDDEEASPSSSSSSLCVNDHHSIQTQEEEGYYYSITTAHIQHRSTEDKKKKNTEKNTDRTQKRRRRKRKLRLSDTYGILIGKSTVPYLYEERVEGEDEGSMASLVLEALRDLGLTPDSFQEASFALRLEDTDIPPIPWSSSFSSAAQHPKEYGGSSSSGRDSGDRGSSSTLPRRRHCTNSNDSASSSPRSPPSSFAHASSSPPHDLLIEEYNDSNLFPDAFAGSPRRHVVIPQNCGVYFSMQESVVRPDHPYSHTLRRWNGPAYRQVCVPEPAIYVQLTLPKGSYATVALREMLGRAVISSPPPHIFEQRYKQMMLLQEEQQREWQYATQHEWKDVRAEQSPNNSQSPDIKHK